MKPTNGVKKALILKRKVVGCGRVESGLSSPLQNVPVLETIPLPSSTPSVSAASTSSSNTREVHSLKRLGNTSKPQSAPVMERSVEEKRLLIRKQLVVLLHSIVCRRRDLNNLSRNEPLSQVSVSVSCSTTKSSA
jgi:hypothetical protein